MKTKLLITTILTSFIASSQVVQSLTPNGFAKPFQIWKDSKDRFEFRIDTPAKAVKVKIIPKKFVIKKGQKYYIEPTMDDPFEVEAKENGQLTLNFSNAHYQYVGIWPTTKNYIPSDLNLKSTKCNLGKLTVTGKNAFTWEKNDQRGLYKSDIKKDIILTPGKRYRLTYKYQCNTVPKIWGAFFYVALQLRNEKGETTRLRNTAGYNVNSNFIFNYLNFTVPANWKKATATLFIAAEFPIKVNLCNFELRDAVTPMRNHPRHHGTATQYSAVISEKNLLKKLEARKPYTVKIARFAERPVLEINGVKKPFTGYSGALGATAAMFNETGYPVTWVSIPLATTYRYRKDPKRPIWLGKDKFNFDNLDYIIKQRLLYTPDQPILLAMSIYPYVGFTDEFPQAAWRTFDGKKLEIETKKGKYFHSITGEIYRREVGRTLRKIGEHLSKSPYGKNVIGLHIGDGGDGQWFSWQHRDWKNFNLDYSEENRKELISLIKKRYKNNIQALRKAWNMPNAEFDNLQIPKPQEWHKYFNKLLDPAIGEQRRLIDWNIVNEDAIVNSIDYLLGEFKAGLKRNVIGTVYFPHDSTSALIRSKNIDGVLSVPFYHSHRTLGGSNFIEQPGGSFRINNKFLLTEIDHRSNFSELACRVGGYDRKGLGVPSTYDGFHSQIRRDYSLALTQGGYAWLLTIAGYNTWSEKFQSVLIECLRAANQTLHRPQWYDWGNIAFIMDFKAQRYSGRSYSFEYNHDRMPRKAIMESGVSYSDYLVEDIGNGRLRNSKIYIFAHNANLTEGQVNYIRKHYQKDNNVLVFTFGTCLGTKGGFEKNIKLLTGFTVKKDLNKEVYFQYANKKSNDPLAKGFEQIHVEKGDKIPLFYVDDKTATPLAWHESNPNLVAAAVKRHKNWTAVYLANGFFSPEFPRALAKEAKLVPTGPVGDITLAGNSLIVVHTKTSGLKTINLPEKSNLIDLTTGQICAYECKSYSFDAKAGQTFWFKVRK
jgi:hypothetical protein